MEKNTDAGNENINAYDLSHILRIEKSSVWSCSPGHCPRDYAGDPSSRSINFSEALKHDKALVENRMQSMNSISIFVRILLLYSLCIRAK